MVSSSPILPLDVQPIRPTRPAPLSLLSPPVDYPYLSPTCPNPPALTPQAARSIPSDWTDDATAVSLDVHGVCPQYRRNSPGYTGTVSSPPHPPSRQFANMPAGWDLTMDQGPYAPLPQGTEAGTTFFYRSPTPSARQRTNQACEKCRDRKTKVILSSGTLRTSNLRLIVHSAAVDVRPVFVVKPGDSLANMLPNIEFVVQREPENETPLRLRHPCLRLRNGGCSLIIIHMLLQRLRLILGGTYSYRPQMPKKQARPREQPGCCRTILMSLAIPAGLLRSSCRKGRRILD
jgi:hypothetical protein